MELEQEMLLLAVVTQTAECNCGHCFYTLNGPIGLHCTSRVKQVQTDSELIGTTLDLFKMGKDGKINQISIFHIFLGTTIL